ncbi:MAG: G5 domain-containing protein, partial [Anaerolineae bacterium]|nr:G5 domain-containing protein [Anaerolineae bacterium]
GEPFVLHTTEIDVGRALDTAGLTLYLADRVTPDLSTAVAVGLVVRIERSLPVTLIADGHTLATRVRGATVAEALLAIALAPIGQDYTIPDLDAPLLPDMTIQLVRVTEALVTKDEPIPYITIYQPDASLPLDENRVLQEGIDGLRTREILVRYEDGTEVSREVQQEWIVQPPQPRMIVYGERVKQP